MRSVALFLLALVAIAPMVFSQTPERAELLAEPKLEEDAKRPEFSDLTAEQVAEKITVTSARNYAWFGFNSPEVQLVLPSADNSVYASVDFSDVTLLGQGGGEVPFEPERGLYEHDTHHDELRFLPVDGEDPVVFDRAVGTVTIRYPLRIRTLTARKGKPAPDGLDVSFDGPYVKIRSRTDADEPPDAASFTGINALRAFNASGAELKAYPSSAVSIANNLRTETKTYWGDVVEFETDVVDEWATIRVSYELPAVEPLPDGRAGIAPEGGETFPPTPGAKVDVDVVVETAGMAVARELGVSKDEAVRRLKDLGYPAPSSDYMVMSALQGRQEALELFLAAGYPIDYVGRSGTALGSAVFARRVNVALYLIEAGADVNIADSNNATPLFHAAGNCQATELVRALVDAGADPRPATAGKTTALQMAKMMKCSENAAIIKAAK